MLEEARNYLWIQGTTVASLVHSKNALDPRHNLVRRRIGRLVEVEETRGDVALDLPLQRRTSFGQRRIVVRPHVHIVEILNEKVSVWSQYLNV